MNEQHEVKMRERGAADGKAAASWFFDGNTPAESYREVLKGIEGRRPHAHLPLPDRTGLSPDEPEVIGETLRPQRPKRTDCHGASANLPKGVHAMSLHPQEIETLDVLLTLVSERRINAGQKFERAKRIAQDDPSIPGVNSQVGLVQSDGGSVQNPPRRDEPGHRGPVRGELERPRAVLTR